MSNRRVAIIGGGPAGLVAAKSLLEEGIQPTVFEASNNLGGIWSVTNQRTWKSLHTNLSKYTCCFSDFPWNQETAIFPSQAEVHHYLISYAKSNNLIQLIRFNSYVEKIQRTEKGKYSLRWKQQRSDDLTSSAAVAAASTTEKEEKIEEFDQVVIASGYFSKPNHQLNYNILFQNPEIKILSSEEYYHPKDFENQTIVIVGGSFSGLEIASELSKVAKKIYHIIPKHSYILPKYLPLDASDRATPFVPIDLLFYELNQQRLQIIQDELYQEGGEKIFSSNNIEVLFKKEEEIQNTHKYFQKMMGSHIYRKPVPKEQHSVFLKYPKQELNYYNDNSFIQSEMLQGKPFVAISDEYRTALHSSEKLQVIAGRVTKIEGNQIYIQAIGSQGGEEATLEQIILANASERNGEDYKVDAVITCTGFHPNVAFLENDILTRLEYDSQDSFAPFIMYKDLLHFDLPGLYFVGMYKGPYFGVMELQAKYVAKLISAKVSAPSLEKYILELELARQNRQQTVRPQFPHSDYVGLMFDLAKEVKQLPSFETLQENRVITPFSFTTVQPIAQRMQEEIQKQLENCRIGKNIPRVIISLLQDRKYRFQRQIHNKLDNSITQVTGTISFDRISHMPIDRNKIREMCASCSIKNTPVLDSEKWSILNRSDAVEKQANEENEDQIFLLYKEEGVLHLPNGQTFEVRQHYIYHYHKERNTIEIFFCQKDNLEWIDYHFLSLQFEKKENNGWIAENEHLCVKDLYKASYLFSFNGLEIEKIQIDFNVGGPTKNYLFFTQLELM